MSSFATKKAESEFPASLNTIADFDCNNDVECNKGSSEIGKCSALKACFNLVALMIGIGMLSLPDAFTQTGWVFGVISIFLAAALSLYSGLLLQRCALEGRIGNCVEEDDTISIIETYPQIGEEAAGLIGKIIASFGAYGTSVGSAILFLVLAIEQFAVVFGDDVLKTYQWGLIFIGCLLPFAYIKTLNHVAIIAVFGAFAALVMFIVVIANCFYELAAGNVTEANYGVIEHNVMPPSASELSKGYVTIAFSYGGACVFPEIMRVMAIPSRFKYALLVSTCIATFIYVTISVVSYAIFGNYIATQSSIVTVLPDSWAMKLVAVMILIHLFSGFLLLLNPVFRELESLFRIEQTDPFGSMKKEYIGRFIIRTLLIGICYFVAVAIPFFGDVMSLIGATTVTLSSFVCPCWFYLALFWPKSWWSWRSLFNAKDDCDQIKEVKVAENDVSMRTANNTKEIYEKDFDDVSVVIDVAQANKQRAVSRRELGKLEVFVIIAIICFSSFVGVMGFIQSISAIATDFQNAEFFSS